MAGSLLEKAKRFDEEQSWLRQFVIPEEDRHLFTTMPWRGEYRWFRSPNVVPLERYRPSGWKWGSNADRPLYRR